LQRGLTKIWLAMMVYTPVHIAAQNGHAKVLKMLLAAGANKDVACNDGFTPVHFAAQNGHAEVLKMLLAAGANKDVACNDGFTPVHFAAQNSHAEVMKMLLAAGANKDVACNDGFTPVHFAAQNGHAEVMKMLLAAGANKDVACNDGFTPVHFAAQNGHAEVLKMLLAAGANEQAVNDSGWTPLHAAACKGQTHTLQVLLEHRADPECKDKQGQTPMDLALKHREAKVVRMLPGGVAIIEKKAKEEQKAFDDAIVVHLLSTRFYIPDGKSIFQCCDPARAATLVKLKLEEGGKRAGHVKVFNPNTDNAFIMGGIAKEANGIWLLNWRRYLTRARETGGKVLQILVDEPSYMQQAEADMALDKGVPVIKICISHLNGPLADFGSTDQHRARYIESLHAFEKLLNDLAVEISSVSDDKAYEKSSKQATILQVQQPLLP